MLKQMTQPAVPDGANDHLRLSVRYHRSPRNRLFGQFDPQRPNSSTDRPAFHQYFPHGEVVDVVRCNGGADPYGCGRDQAIPLMQRHAVLGEFSAPVARLDGLCNTERRQAQPIEQMAGGTFLTLSQTSPNLLDGYCANPRLHAASTQAGYPRCGRPTPKCVDQDGRIEQQPGHASTRPAIIAPPLPPHPLRRVVVPRVTAVIYAAQRRFDVVPTPLIVETPLDEFADESAASPGAGASIKFHDEGVGQRYV